MNRPWYLLSTGFVLALAGAWLVGCVGQRTVRLPVLGGTPVPYQRVPITLDNVDEVTELAVWGKGTIREIAFSPDERLMAVGTSAGIWVYDVETLETERFIDTGRGVRSLAFMPEGNTLLVHHNLLVHPDHEEISFWDVETGRRTTDSGNGEMEREAEQVPSSQTQGASVHTEIISGTIRLREAATGNPLGMVDGFAVLVEATSAPDIVDAVVSPDGLIYTYIPTSHGTDIQLWDPQTGQVVHTLTGSRFGITNLDLSADGETLVAGLWGGSTVLFWDLAGDKGTWGLGADGRLTVVALSPDGAMEAHNFSCYRGGTVLRDLRTQERTNLLVGQVGCPYDLTFSPDGTDLAMTAGIGAEIGIVAVVDTESGRLRNEVHLEEKGVGLAFSRDGEMLVIGGENGTVRLLEVETGRVARVLEGHTDPVRSLVYSPDGTLLAVGLGDPDPFPEQDTGGGSIWLWDVETGTLLRVFDEYSGNVVSLAFTPDGSLLVSASLDGTVRLWGVPALRQ